MKNLSAIKFDELGHPKEYFGNTIICMLDERNCNYFEHLQWIHRQIRNACYRDKLAILPESSLHMTIKGLVRDIDRKNEKTDEWSPYLDRQASWQEIDRFCYEQFKKLDKLEGFYMEYLRCSERGLYFRPIDKSTNELLKKYYKILYELIGVEHFKYEEYTFHISFAYKLFTYTIEEQKAINGAIEEMDKYLREHMPVIKLPEAKFTIFHDMHEYIPDISKRKRL